MKNKLDVNSTDFNEILWWKILQFSFYDHMFTYVYKDLDDYATEHANTFPFKFSHFAKSLNCTGSYRPIVVIVNEC